LLYLLTYLRIEEMTHRTVAYIAITCFMFAATEIAKGQTNHAGNLKIHTDSTRQTVTGFGASLAYYEGWLNAHPNRAEVYEAVFGELSLDILRVRTAYDYDPDMVGRVREYVEASELVRGDPIPVLATSWGPPGYLKNTGDKNNGGTLRYAVEDGEVKFDYGGFARWWKNAMLEYHANGIYPAYITIQNEPGWEATWETCLMSPSETVNGTDTIAGYNLALDAVYDSLQGMEPMPQILGPEYENIFGNTLENYVNALDINKLDGISHHLYYGANPADPFSSPNFARMGDIHPEIPHFQTEYSSDNSDWFSLAGLIYMSFHEEEVVAYLYWDLIWVDGKGLVTLEFPWDPGRWTDPSKGYIKNKHFYSFKQFSAFVHPGWKRVDLDLSATTGAALAFISPGRDSATAVLINRSLTDSLSVRLDMPGYRIHESAVYTTSESENCELKGALIDSLLTMAPRSIATLDMRITPYDPAEDTVAPSVPQNLQLVEATPGSITLAWDPSTDSIGVAGYRVFVDGTPEATTLFNSYTVTGLMPETTYGLEVSAYDEALNESALSELLHATTLIVPDTTPPLLEVTDTVYGDGMGVIEAISSEPGMVYLVRDGTAKDIEVIRTESLDSAEVEGGIPVLMMITGLDNGSYLVYAADTVLNLSDPARVVVLGVGIDSDPVTGFISYPNPFSSATSVRLTLLLDQQLTLSVYDGRGVLVRKEPLGGFHAGTHRIIVRREGMEEGHYFFRLENDRGMSWSGRWIIQD